MSREETNQRDRSERLSEQELEAVVAGGRLGPVLILQENDEAGASWFFGPSSGGGSPLGESLTTKWPVTGAGKLD